MQKKQKKRNNNSERFFVPAKATPQTFSGHFFRKSFRLKKRNNKKEKIKGNKFDKSLQKVFVNQS